MSKKPATPPPSKKGLTPPPKASAPPPATIGGGEAPPKRHFDSVEKCFTREVLREEHRAKNWGMFDGEGSQICKACGHHMAEHETVAKRDAREAGTARVFEVTQGMQAMHLGAPLSHPPATGIPDMRLVPQEKAEGSRRTRCPLNIREQPHLQWLQLSAHLSHGCGRSAVRGLLTHEQIVRTEDKKSLKGFAIRLNKDICRIRLFVPRSDHIMVEAVLFWATTLCKEGCLHPSEDNMVVHEDEFELTMTSAETKHLRFILRPSFIVYRVRPRYRLHMKEQGVTISDDGKDDEDTVSQSSGRSQEEEEEEEEE
eukprot:PhM_4_TR6477/c0_g1_i2/m.58130